MQTWIYPECVMSRGSAQRRSLRQERLCLVAALGILLALSLGITLSFHRYGRPLRDINAIERVVEFNNPKPFVLRVFTTALVDGLYAATPRIIKDRLLSSNSGVGRLAARLARNGDLLDNRLAIHWFYYAATAVAFLLLYAGLVARMAKCLGMLPPVWCFVAAVLSLVTLPPYFIHGYGYIYDPAVLVFAAAMTYAMYRGRHVVYLALFALACFNKETTILFTPLYVYYFRHRLPPARLAAMAAAQVALFLAIYVGLQRIFAGNEGVIVEHYWLDQFNYFVEPDNWPSLVAIMAMALLFALGYSGAHALLRGVFVIAVPLGVLFLYGGWPGEYRVFLEVWPLVIVTWTIGAYRLYTRVTGPASPQAA